MSEMSAKRHMGLKASRTLSNTLIHILLIVISVIWLIPFVCILLQSFRVESTGPVGYVVPQQWGVDNYTRLFQTDFPGGIPTPSSRRWSPPCCRRSSSCA